MTNLCPASDTLESFADARLDDEEMATVEKHLVSCDACHLNVERLEREPRDPLRQRLRQVETLPQDVSDDAHDLLLHIATKTANPPEVDEPVPEQIGQYKILGRLGGGGMGTVYRALHPHLHREVAVKVVKESRALDPAAKERFQREVLAAGKLHHPNIVQTFDAGFVESEPDRQIELPLIEITHEVGAALPTSLDVESNSQRLRISRGRPFLVMEILKGHDLGEHVERHGKLRPELACDYVRQAALGLRHAHDAGIVHRDIKPSNLFLTDDGTVKILDLGLATLRDDTESPAPFWEKDVSASKTATGHILGSPDFLSPEQALGLPVDGRSDIYSLGCTLHYLLSGTAPFGGDRYSSLQDKLAGHVRDDLPKLPLPKRIGAVLKKMVAKSPENRPSAAEIAVALAPRRPVLRTTILVALFVVMLCVTIYIVARRDDGAEPFFNRAVALMNDERNDEALRELNEAIRRRPSFVEAYNKRAGVHFQLGDHKSAATDHAEAIRLFPEDNSSYVGRGINLLQTGDLHKALDDLNHALGRNPNDVIALIGRSETLRLLKRLDEALIDAENAVRLKPNEAHAYNNRGTAYMEFGRIDEAIKNFNEAIRLDATIPIAYNNRGWAFGEVGEHEKAMVDLDKAIEMDPKLAMAYNNRGNLKIRLGDNQGAITDLDLAITFNPALALAYNNRGLAKFNLGRHMEAVRDCDKAIELDPNLPHAYHNRGLARLEIGGYDEAVADFDKAVTLNPSLTLCWLFRGAACMESGRSEDAVADFTRFLQSPSPYTSLVGLAYSLRSEAYEHLGEPEKADSDAVKAKESGYHGSSDRSAAQ